ncbi:hypothetical protein ACFCWG_32410 [Streptomyces sp. NPDC056390]|uniref:hypothetical protein n=1 Tax=Streptomyces sp. NPDC056390 TaxID=3345806 RepID=UPI0035DCBD38
MQDVLQGDPRGGGHIAVYGMPVGLRGRAAHGHEVGRRARKRGGVTGSGEDQADDAVAERCDNHRAGGLLKQGEQDMPEPDGSR